MVRGWATRAVSIPSLLLRAATDLQTGREAAMLGSLAIESGSVLLRDAAMISLSRADRARPRKLIFPMLRGPIWALKRPEDVVNVSAVTLLCLTTFARQFTSTILLSDLRVGTLPGISYESHVAYDFEYTPNPFGFAGINNGGWAAWVRVDFPIINRGTTWQRNPPSYPAFAEYSEPVVSQDGLDNTGVLLRGFLPFPDAQSRENIRNYSGKALVLDSRVSCQRPRLANLQGGFGVSGGQLAFSSIVGTFAPSIDSERLWSPEGVCFNCSYLIGNDIYSVCELQTNASTGALTVQMNNRAGGLISEFANLTDPEHLRHWAKTKPNAFLSWGTPLIILNVSTPYLENVDYLWYKDDFTDAVEYYYDMKNDSTLRVVENGIYTDIITESGPANLSISVCYTAWDTARLKVDMFSEANRTEPIPHYKNGTGIYTTPDVSQQLGNTGVQDPSLAAS